MVFRSQIPKQDSDSIYILSVIHAEKPQSIFSAPLDGGFPLFAQGICEDLVGKVPDHESTLLSESHNPMFKMSIHTDPQRGDNHPMKIAWHPSCPCSLSLSLSPHSFIVSSLYIVPTRGKQVGVIELW